MMRRPLLLLLLLVLLAALGYRGCRPVQVAQEHSGSRGQVCATRPEELAQTEFAMIPGQTITATTPTGTIEIRAVDWLERSYTWEGATRSVVMWPRTERWYGSLGIYYPGPGRHWKAHRGITRGVVEEGQQKFGSIQEAVDWIRELQQWLPCVYTQNGLVVGWMTVPGREQLNVDVWQIVINGQKPSALPGSTDASICVSLPNQSPR